MNLARAYRWLFGAALCAIYLLAVLPSAAVPGVQLWDKFNHALAFFVLATLMARGWPETQLLGVRLATLLAYGLLIELSQLALPYRDASWQDMVANGFGLLLYVLMHYILGRRRSAVSR